MTNEEALKALEESVEQSRHRAAKVVGPAMVVAIEGQGLRIVTVAFVDEMRALLSREAQPEAGKKKRG